MGGGGGIPIVSDVVNVVEDAVKDVGGFIQDNVIDPIKDVGSEIDDFVNEEIPGGWYTVGAATGAGLLGSGTLVGEALATEGAIAGDILGTGAEIGSVADALSGATGAFDAGLGLDAMSGGTGYVTGTATTAPVVPSAFDSAVQSAISGTTPEVGSFGNVATGGFGTAIPTASETAAGLTAAGFAPGTAANLSGLTQAGVGAATTVPSVLSLGDAFRAARLANALFAQPQPQQINPYQLMGQQQAGIVDYTPTLNLLATRPTNPYSLV